MPLLQITYMHSSVLHRCSHFKKQRAPHALPGFCHPIAAEIQFLYTRALHTGALMSKSSVLPTPSLVVAIQLLLKTTGLLPNSLYRPARSSLRSDARASTYPSLSSPSNAHAKSTLLSSTVQKQQPLAAQQQGVFTTSIALCVGFAFNDGG